MRKTRQTGICFTFISWRIFCPPVY